MKQLLLISLFSAGTMVANGQGFYFRTGLGYAFAQAGQTMDGAGTPYSGTLNNTTGTYRIKSASFSAGLHGYLGLGYMFNKNVGVQLDADLGLGPKKYSFTANNVTLGAGVPGSVTFETQANSFVLLVPSLVLQTGPYKKWNIYSRFGIALPLSTKITQDQIQVNAPGTGARTVDDFTFSVKNSFSLGFVGAAGVKYKVNDRVTLWGELSLLSLSVYIKQMELTDVSENGQSVPLSAVSGNIITNYSKNITSDSTGANQPAYSQPFSNVSLNFGVSFTMGSRHHRYTGRSDDRAPADEQKSNRPRPTRFK